MKRVVGMAVLLGIVTACVAQERVPSIRRSRKKLLSAVLPAPLGRFVERYGTDRRLSTLERITYGDGDLTGATPVAVINLLQPQAYFTLAGPVTLLEKPGLAEVRHDVKGAQTILLAATNVSLISGVDVPIADDLFPGDTIQEGMVLNGGDKDVLVQAVFGQTVLRPGEALIVTLNTSVAGRACEACCTDCEKGYYSCCNNSTGRDPCAHCFCVKKTNSASCDSGGEGSTGCCVGKAAIDQP